ncbi:MAG TPA: GNAT family N-acetyltransferase [Caulobacteraceae bacterium]|jgi:phosphinothricin acetyltransferase
MKVRPATTADAPAVTVIYAEHVKHGTGTFEETAPTTADMTARMRAVLDMGFPWVVVEDQGRILAYAYAGPYHHRSAYRFTAEDSVYVAEHARGRGYGKAALEAVIAGCRAMGMRRLLGVIGDSGNTASVALHRSLGFEPCGTLPAVGYKAGKWLDVVLMHLPLNGGNESQPA